MRLVMVTLFLTGSCVACGSPNLATPRPSDGPAFAALNRASTEVCGQDVCVSQDVVNMGNICGPRAKWVLLVNNDLSGERGDELVAEFSRRD